MVDAAFIWGPSAGYINHASLHDAYKVVPVDAPQMQWQAAIGFSSKQTALRDEVDAVLARLEPRIRDLSAKYAVAACPSVTMTDGGPLQVAPATAPAPLPPAGAEAAAEPSRGAGDAAHGKALFTAPAPIATARTRSSPSARSTCACSSASTASRWKRSSSAPSPTAADQGHADLEGRVQARGLRRHPRLAEDGAGGMRPRQQPTMPRRYCRVGGRDEGGSKPLPWKLSRRQLDVPLELPDEPLSCCDELPVPLLSPLHLPLDVPLGLECVPLDESFASPLDEPRARCMQSWRS